MASTRNSNLIKKIAFLLLFLAIAAAVWIYDLKLDAPWEKIAKVAKENMPIEKVPVKNGDEKPGGANGGMNVHSEVPEDASAEDLDKFLKGVTSPDKGVAIVHYHLPGDPSSEQLADVFNAIQKKYGPLVKVVRIGFPAQTSDKPTTRAIKLPFVVMIVGTENVFQFQGLWPLAQVDKKVQELVFGVRPMNKDWRPPVSGMTPKSR
jgi:hypothetical protein